MASSRSQVLATAERGAFSATSHPPMGMSSVRMNVIENQPHRIALDDFGFSDPNDSPADKFYSVLITALPVYQGLEGGRLLLDGVPVTTGQEILATDILANKLQFVPTATSIDTTRPHRNYVNYLDVDHNGLVESNDRQLLSSQLASGNGFPILVPPPIPSNAASNHRYYDVDGDNQLSSHDLQLLTDYLITMGSGHGKGLFEFKVKDSGQDNNVALTANVMSFELVPTPSVPPIATSDNATAIEAGGKHNTDGGVNPKGNVLLNDSDANPGDPIRVYGVVGGERAWASGGVGSVVLGTYGSIVMRPSGEYEYTVDNTNATVQALRWPSSSLKDVFTYTVQDASGLTSSTQLSISIFGSNDAPTILSNGGGAIATVYVPYKTTAITTVQARDVDSPALTYSFIQSRDSTRFQLNSRTGELRFADFPPSGPPALAGRQEGYKVPVRVSDGNLSSEQLIEVMLTVPPIHLQDIRLERDTGDSTDSLTADPRIRFSTSGQWQALVVEFDHDGDGVPNGSMNIASNGPAVYDPRTSDPAFSQRHGAIVLGLRTVATDLNGNVRVSSWLPTAFSQSPIDASLGNGSLGLESSAVFSDRMDSTLIRNVKLRNDSDFPITIETASVPVGFKIDTSAFPATLMPGDYLYVNTSFESKTNTSGKLVVRLRDESSDRSLFNVIGQREYPNNGTPINGSGDIKPTEKSSAHFKGDGNAQDSVAANHGMAIGTVAFAPGMESSAFDFDGVEDEIKLPQAIWLINNSARTYSFWFKVVDQGYNRNLLAQQFANGNGWGLQLDATNRLTLRVNTTSLVNQVPYQQKIPLGWHFVSLTLNDVAKQVSVQLDSLELAGAAYVGGLDSIAEGFMTVGGAAMGASRFLGRIDELRVYESVVPDWVPRQLFQRPVPDLGNVRIDGVKWGQGGNNPSSQSIIALNPNLLPVYALGNYEVRAHVDVANGQVRSSAGLSLYDLDGQAIDWGRYADDLGNQDTQLLSELRPGDTTIRVKDVSRWYQGADPTLRGLTILDDDTSLGDLPTNVASLRVFPNAWSEGAFSGNLIRLNAPYSGPVFPVGTTVRNASLSNRMRSNLLNNATLTVGGHDLVARLGGLAISGDKSNDRFLPDTSFIGGVALAADGLNWSQFSVDALDYLTIPENAQVGWLLGRLQSKTDVSFYLAEDGEGRFSIDPNSGEIKVASNARIDHESNAFYSIVVGARGGNQHVFTKRFRVYVRDVNEPLTDLVTATNELADEGAEGQVAGKVQGIDPDQTDRLRYEIETDPSQRFSINSVTGEITVRGSQPLLLGSYAILVKATDLAGHSLSTTINVSVNPFRPSWPAGSVQQLVVSSSAAYEGTLVPINIFRSDASKTATVNYTTRGLSAIGTTQTGVGGDFVSQSGTLHFAVGETHKTVFITTLYDFESEETETLLLDIASPELGNAVGSIRLLNESLPVLTVDTATTEVNEGETAALVFGWSNYSRTTYLAQLPRAFPDDLQLRFETKDWTAEGGTLSDYESYSETYTSTLGGLTNSKFLVKTNRDFIRESDESFYVAVTTPWNSVEKFRVKIKDASDRLPKAVFDYLSADTLGSVNSNGPSGGSTHFKLYLNEGEVTGNPTNLYASKLGILLSEPFTEPIEVRYQLVPGSATLADYSEANATITFQPGEVWKPINIVSYRDNIRELDESFFAVLQTPWQQVAEATIVLKDERLPILSVSDIDIAFGQSATFTITLDQPSTIPFVASYSNRNGVINPWNFTPSSGTIDFLPGEVSKTITIPTAFGPDPLQVPKLIDLFLDVRTSWDQDTAHAVINNPVGTTLSLVGPPNAMDSQYVVDLSTIYDLKGGGAQSPNYFTGVVSGGGVTGSFATLLSRPSGSSLELYADGRFKFRPSIVGKYDFSYQLDARGHNPTTGIVRFEVVDSSVAKQDLLSISSGINDMLIGPVIANDMVIGKTDRILGLSKVVFDPLRPDPAWGVGGFGVNTREPFVCLPQDESYLMLGQYFLPQGYADLAEDCYPSSLLQSGERRLESDRLRQSLGIEYFESGFIQLDTPYVYGPAIQFESVYRALATDANGVVRNESQLIAKTELNIGQACGGTASCAPVGPPIANVDDFGVVGFNSSYNLIGNVFANDRDIVIDNVSRMARDKLGRPLSAIVPNERQAAIIQQALGLNEFLDQGSSRSRNGTPLIGTSSRGGRYSIAPDGDVHYTPPIDFVGEDTLGYVVVADDGKMGIVGSDQQSQMLHHSIIGNMIRIRVGPDALPLPDNRTSSTINTSWTHNPDGPDSYQVNCTQCTDEGIFVWNDHNSGSVDLTFGELQILNNDRNVHDHEIEIKGPNGAFASYSNSPTAVGVDVAGLSVQLAVGFIGDTFVEYRLKRSNGISNQTSEWSTIKLSVHGQQYAKPAVPDTVPYFVSTPIQVGFAGEVYLYKAQAIDAERSQITYELVGGPEGMVLNPSTGEISWPIPTDLRDRTQVRIHAMDSSRNTAIQQFYIDVSANNHAPRFTSEPIVFGRVGELYEYEFSATDADGDPLSFELVTPTDWEITTLQNGTGRLRHLGTNQDSKVPVSVIIAVHDNLGASSTQAFPVVFRDSSNRPPVITSVPAFRYENAASNLEPLGNVTDTRTGANRLWFNLAEGDTATASVAFSLADGPPKVDVMLMLDDTYSFQLSNRDVADKFAEVVDGLRSKYPEIDFGFGVSRFEEYFVPKPRQDQEAYWLQSGTEGQTSFQRPFILNQPILEASYSRFNEVMESALSRTGLGAGNPAKAEAFMEGLFQLATGVGWDGNNNGLTSDSGATGTWTSQLASGLTGDVPTAFQTNSERSLFTTDPSISVGYSVVRIQDQPMLPFGSLDVSLKSDLKASVWKLEVAGGTKLMLTTSVAPQEYLEVYSPTGNRVTPEITQVDQARWTVSYELPTTGRYAVIADRQPKVKERSRQPDVLNYREMDNESTVSFSMNVTMSCIESEFSPLADPLQMGAMKSTTVTESEPKYVRFEVQEPSLLFLQDAIGNLGNWQLISSDGLSIQNGAGSATIVSQFPSQDANRLSPVGAGTIGPGVYYLRIDPQANGKRDIQFRILSSKEIPTHFIGKVTDGVLPQTGLPYLAKFNARSGQTIELTASGTPGGYGGPGDIRIVFPDGTSTASPAAGSSVSFTAAKDGEYFVHFKGLSSNSGVPFQFSSQVVHQSSNPTYSNRTYVTNSEVSERISDIHSIVASYTSNAYDQLYFDGRNANARVRVDAYNANGSVEFSLTNSEFNRMLPTNHMPSVHSIKLEPIDLAASVPTNRLGGGGFRPGALPIIIAATDTGTRYRVDQNEDGTAILDVRGVTRRNGDSVTSDLRNIVGESFYEITDPTHAMDPLYVNFLGEATPIVPSTVSASVQDAVSALVKSGALLVGLGTSPVKDTQSRPLAVGSMLSEMAKLTGAVDSTDGTPLYVQLPTDGTGTVAGEYSKQIENAILKAIDTVEYDIDVVLRDANGVAVLTSSNGFTVRPDEIKINDLMLRGDGNSHAFYMEFFRHNTNVLLGRIPIGINSAYLYDVEALDADGDELAFSLLGESHGAMIDSATGEIIWNPPASGMFEFSVQVSDGRGGTDIQTWSVDASTLYAKNHPPSLDSISNRTASVSRPFELQVHAFDPDGDMLRYSLIQEAGVSTIPAGMDIDAKTGLIGWTPSPLQVGIATVSVNVEDGRGGSSKVRFEILVNTGSELGNHRPVITSSPSLLAVVGEHYRYEVEATDEDNDSLSYSLVAAPANMVFDSQSRTLVWLPNADEIGTASITLTVSDPHGGVTYQAFKIDVLEPNQAPVFSETLSLDILNNKAWEFFPAVQDPNGDRVLLSLVSGPTGLVVAKDTNGNMSLVKWHPTLIGEYSFVLAAEDSRGGRSTYRYLVRVVSDISPPPRLSGQPQGPAVIGEVWNYEVTAIEEESSSVHFQLVDPPAGMTISSITTNPNNPKEHKAKITWIPATIPGNYHVHLWVTDDEQRLHGSAQIFTLPVRVPNQPPIIESIPYDAMVGAPWTYKIFARDPDEDHLSYELIQSHPGLSLDKQSGLLKWTPTVPNETNSMVAKIRVDDGHGGNAEQEVSIRVLPSTNQGWSPYVVNNPTGPVWTNAVWTHQLQALDPNGEASKIAFALQGFGFRESDLTSSNAVSVSGAGLVSVDPSKVPGIVLDSEGYLIQVRMQDESGAISLYELRFAFSSLNQWPSFIELAPPSSELTSGARWTIQSNAIDRDGPAAVKYSSPIDTIPVNPSGFVDFTVPANSTQSTFPLVIRATDGSQTADGNAIHVTQAVTLIRTDHPVNAPRITSQPSVATYVSDTVSYFYQVRSPDGPLTYRLATGPSDMSIDANGLVSWKPSEFGNYPVAIEVTDTNDRQTVQRFTVSAVKPYVLNKPPEIISKPTGPAARDLKYSYQVSASDVNSDTLAFSLALGSPEGMSINQNTGLLEWTPTVAGQFPVEVVVREVKQPGREYEALETRQAFTLTVLRNAPPEFTQVPIDGSFIIGSTSFSSQIFASDPNVEDRAKLRYTLVSPPPGAKIDSDGLFTYTTNDIESLGKHTITVRVQDPSGAEDIATFAVQALSEQNHAPNFVSRFRNSLPAGKLYALELVANDPDGDDVLFALEGAPSGMKLENSNILVWTPPKEWIDQRIRFTIRTTSKRELPTKLEATQDVDVLITSSVVNNAPVVVSTAKRAAIVGLPYRYHAVATDQDYDTVSWRLNAGPNGLSVDRRSGVVTWTPTMNQLGEHAVSLIASDGFGGLTMHSFTIVVRESNLPPVITSDPPSFAEIGKEYIYQIQAHDIEGSELTYSLSGDVAEAEKLGWRINSRTGVLTITPTKWHNSRYQVSVSAKDEYGGEVTQDIEVTTFDPLINKPPVFTNSLPDYWVIDGMTQYRMLAVDSSPGNSQLRFSGSARNPSGMSIDPLTGVIQWQPTLADVGLHSVVVRADDNQFVAHHSKQVMVRTNELPVIESVADQRLTGGLDWEFRTRASDRDGDPLRYALTVLDAPSSTIGLSIDPNTGLLTWPTPIVSSSQSYLLRVYATDPLGGSSQIDFRVILDGDLQGPTVSFQTNPVTLETDNSQSGALPDSRIRNAQVIVSAVDNVGVDPTSLVLQLVGFRSSLETSWDTSIAKKIELDSLGRAILTTSMLVSDARSNQVGGALGFYQFQVSAQDKSGNVGTKLFEVKVAPDATAPKLSIKLPFYNQTILEPIDIVGSIDDESDQLAEYIATIQSSAENASPITIARVVGNKEVSNGVLATLDPTLLDNGVWTLTVTAKDRDGNVSVQSVPFQIEGYYKPGTLAFTFTDLEFTTSDVPLKIQRSYSNNRIDKTLDFGVGWSLDFGIPQIEIAYDPMAPVGTSGNQVLLDGTRVVVTLSDGTRESFTFSPYPEEPNSLGMATTWIPYFAPDRNNTTALEVAKVPVQRVALGETWEYVSISNTQSYHPAMREFGGFWNVYMQSGPKIQVDARSENTAWIYDKNGNKTTITPDGIEHWSGRRIAIQRDSTSAKRITSVIDSAGNAIYYGYNAIGNLAYFIDRSGQATSYSYHAAIAADPLRGHLLKSITDPAGRAQMVAEFAGDRRLSSIQDTSKFVSAFSYDIRNRNQRIDVGDNGVTNDDVVQDLDRRGNPIRVIDSANVETRNKFDGQGNLLENRKVVGAADGASGLKDDMVTSYIYNQFRQPFSMIDARGLTTQYRYDDKTHSVVSVISNSGLATRYQYDRDGNLTSTLSPTGDKTTLSYSDRGKLEEVENQRGHVVTQNEYDSFGDLVSKTNADQHVNRFEYDSLGRQIAIISVETGENGLPLEVRNENVFDVMDRVVQTRVVHRSMDNQGNWSSELQWTISTIFDPKTGLIRQQSDKHGLRTEFYYDRSGKTILMRNEVETRVLENSEFVLRRVWTSQWTVYDEQGRLLYATDASLESAGQLFVSPKLITTKTIYDQAGRVVGSQRLADVKFRIVDDNQRPPDETNEYGLHCEIVPGFEGYLLSSTETVFDQAGRVWKTRDGNGLWSMNFYGFAGDIVQTRTQSVSGSGAVVWTVSRTAVDDLGRTIVAMDPILEVDLARADASPLGTRTFYDSLGRSEKVERRFGIRLTLLDRNGSVVENPDSAQGPFSVRIDNQGVASNGTINLISRSQSFFDARGQLVRSISGVGPGHEGIETRFEYDARGRQFRKIGPLVQTVDSVEPIRLVTETEYDEQGQPFRSWTNIRAREINGQLVFDRQYAIATEQIYDALGRTVKSVQPDKTFTQVVYDKWGNKVEEIDTAGRKETNEYGANGRLIAVVLPAVPNPLALDANGNPKIESPRFDYGFDWAGNQTILRDSLGRVSRFVFDELNRKTSRILPSGEVERFTYNSHGQQSTHVSFEGVVKESVYDNARTDVPVGHPEFRPGSGRLVEERFYSDEASYNSGNAEPDTVIRHTYDIRGRKIRTQFSQRVAPGSYSDTRLEQWFYNDRGQLIQEASPEGAINFAYDPVSDRRVRMWTTKAAGLDAANLADAVEDTRYTYNEQGWMTEVRVLEKNDQPLATNQQERTVYGYDLTGNRVRETLPNGVTVTTELNANEDVTLLTHFGPDATPFDLKDNPKIAEFSYTYDLARKRTSQIDQFWMDSDNNPLTPRVAQSTVYRWTYDDAERLISESIDSFDDEADRFERFDLDLFGNRIKSYTSSTPHASDVDKSIQYLYDLNDRLQSESIDEGNNGSVDQTTTYAWSGTQQALKSVSAGAKTLSTQRMFYNLQGQLVSLETEMGGADGASPTRLRVDYQYNSSGIRTVAMDWVDANQDGQFDLEEQTDSTEYQIDSANQTGYQQAIAETIKNRQGQIKKRIVYSYGIDELTQTTTDYTQSSSQPSVSTHVFGHDAHRSVRLLLGVDAGLIQAFTFAAYGELLSIRNAMNQSIEAPDGQSLESAALSRMLYNGESFDSRIGQLYLRARWYNPLVGRFGSLDPYGGNPIDPFSWNKYAYTSGDPIKWNDPTGLFEGLAGFMVSVGVRATMAGINAGIAFQEFHAAAKYEGSLKPLAKLNANQKADALKYAKLAVATYVAASRDGVLDDLIASGWEVLQTERDDSTGYRTLLFMDKTTGEKIMSFSGTDDIPDIIADIQQGTIGGGSQYDRAIRDAISFEAKFGRIDHVTGHSLGGGLASHVALVRGIEATTFNAAGLNIWTLNSWGHDLSDADKLIRAYRVRGEFLSTIQDANPAWALSLFTATGLAVLGVAGIGMPNGVGTAYWLPHTSSDIFSRHKMVTDVIPGINRA